MATYTIGTGEDYTTLQTFFDSVLTTDKGNIQSNMVEAVTLGSGDGCDELYSDNGSTWTYAGSSRLLYFNGYDNDILFRDLDIDKTTGGTGRVIDIVSLGSSVDIEFRDCKIQRSTNTDTDLIVRLGLNLTSTRTLKFDRCTLDGLSTSTEYLFRCATSQTGSNNIFFYNCMLRDATASPGEGIDNNASSVTYANIQVYNCTFFNCTTAIASNANDQVDSCFFGGNTDDVDEGTNFTIAGDFTYCGFCSTASGSGTGNQFNLTIANEVVNPTNGADLTPKVGGNIIDAGTNKAGGSTDVLGNPRVSGSQIDIGAIEAQQGRKRVIVTQFQ